jgi:iron complex outermembrane receptor protein
LFPEGPTNISRNPFVVGNNATDKFTPDAPRPDQSDNYAKDKIQRVALDVHYTFGDGLVLRSVSGGQWIQSYIRNDDDGSVTMDRRQHINAKFRVYTQEIWLTSPAEERFSWFVGSYFREETLDFPPAPADGFVLTDATHYIPGAQIIEIDFPWHTPRRTIAAFGQAAYQFTDTLKLEAGLRWGYFHVSEEGHLAILPQLIDPPNGIALPDFVSYDETSVSGKVALNWQMTANHYFYAFVATGNTTGGVNVVPGVPDYDNQTTTDFELGWKGQLFDGHLLTQIGGFYENVDDYQATFIDANTGLGAYQNLNGTSHIFGSEVSAQAVFGDLSVDIGTAWIHSELGSALIVDNITGETIDTDGNRQPFAPQYTFHGGLQYEVHLPGSMTLTPRGDYAWIDEQTTTPLDAKCTNPAICPLLGAELDRIESHQQVNLRLTLDAQNWSLAGFLTNATDERYIEAHGGPGYNAYVNPRRTGGVKFTYNFGGGEH